MMKLMTLSDAVETAQKLIGVAFYEDPDIAQSVVSVSLIFESGAVHFSACGDDDTIVFKDKVEHTLSTQKAYAHDVFGEAFGKTLFYAWAMQNTKGYPDAIQLEFDDETLSNEVIIQIKAIASSLHFFRVTRIPEHHV
jgi:hypothetical protein